MNGFAERMVGMLKRGVLNKIIIADVAGLEAACAEFLAHYHDERPHQGLGNILINPPAAPQPAAGVVVRHDRLGGLIHHYAREAA
jgi:transposase InsO family protein